MTRYELLERIGAGRMAELFRGKAVAAGGFEKPVAIKRILPHLSKDPRFVELLIAESKILSALRHRNIVQIFDVGLGEDGAYFLVMEYVDGVDLGVLQRVLERRRAKLPIDLVLHLGAEVCDALDHAQQTPTPDGRPMNLVHRDVSPSNVLVSRSGEVKLTDFGLARRPEDRRTAGGLRGRFGYVSPEQVAGLPVDGRSDVFSLGVVMWELAAGRRLFSGMADYEALRAITDVPIPPPSTQDRGLPAELDAILAEALSRDVERRLPSAGELGKRLRGLRYSLESSSGDPASGLARMLTGVEREPLTLPATLAEGIPMAPSFDSGERSVVKIRTAEVFAQRDPDGTGLLEARRLLEAFEDAETRMSSLPVAFDDISSTGGHSLKVFDERTELSAPPVNLGHDTSEVQAAIDSPRDTSEVALGDGGDAGRDTGEVMRDTGETAAVEGPTIPAPSSASGAAGSLVSTIRGGGAVPVPPLGSGGPPVARGPSPAEGARGAKPVDTVRGGQAAPLPAYVRPVRASTATPTPVREPVTIAAARAAARDSSAPPREQSPPASSTPVRDAAPREPITTPSRGSPREPSGTPSRAASTQGSSPSRAGTPREAGGTPARAGTPREPSGTPSRAASTQGSSPSRAGTPREAGGTPARAPAPRVERRLADWSDRAESSVDSDWTEKTPPPPMPPTDADPQGGASLLGSLSSLPSLGALSAGPPVARPLPGMSSTALSIHTSPTLPPSGARSPFATPSPGARSSPAAPDSLGALSPESSAAITHPSSPAMSLPPPPAMSRSSSPGAPMSSPGSPMSASSSPGMSLPAGALPEPASAASRSRRDEPPADPSRSYPPASSAPWGWMPPPAPSAGVAALRRWWPVALGALAIAILSFVITQAAIDPEVGLVRSAAPADAAAAILDAAEATPAVALDAGEAAAVLDATAASEALDAAALAGDAAAIATDDGGALLPGAGEALDAGVTALDAGASGATAVEAGTAPADVLDAGAATPAATPARPTASKPKPSRPPRRERSRSRSSRRRSRLLD